MTDWGGGWIPNLRRDGVTSLDFGKSVLPFCAEGSCVVVQIRGLTHMCCVVLCACNWRVGVCKLLKSSRNPGFGGSGKCWIS